VTSKTLVALLLLTISHHTMAYVRQTVSVTIRKFQKYVEMVLSKVAKSVTTLSPVLEEGHAMDASVKQKQ